MIEKPIEVWALQDDAYVEPHLIGAMDEDDGFLAYMSESDANRGAVNQQSFFGISCHPVRIA